MSMVALDWNATRVRAVQGAADGYPLLLPLEPPHADLPLAISMGTGRRGRQRRLASMSASAGPGVPGVLAFSARRAGSRAALAGGRHIVRCPSACEFVWASSARHRHAGIVLTLPGYLQTRAGRDAASPGRDSRAAVLGLAADDADGRPRRTSSSNFGNAPFWSSMWTIMP